MNEMVNYNNKINGVALEHFNARELDLFVAICSKMKDESTSEVVFDFEDLRSLIRYDISLSSEKFYSLLVKTYTKLLRCIFGWENEKEAIYFVLFTVFKIDKNNKNVSIGINPQFTWVLNELSSNFTKFELSEFVELKSKYAKECYRRLKEFRLSGYWIVELEKFRRLLNVPKSYKMYNINQKILQPIYEELSIYFKNFKIEKIKKGSSVVRLKFTFVPEEDTRKIYFKTENEAIIWAYKNYKTYNYTVEFDIENGYYIKLK